VTRGEEIVASEVAKATATLKRFGVPVPSGAGPLELAEIARAWLPARRDRVEGWREVRCAADILEAAADCPGEDPLAAGFVLGERVAGTAWAYGGFMGKLATADRRNKSTEDGRKKAGDGAKRAGHDYAMKKYGSRALEIIREIIQEGERSSIESLIDEMRDRWPEGQGGLPISNRAIRNLLGDSIKSELLPRLRGRRRRVV
jgi:hypothetical protein